MYKQIVVGYDGSDRALRAVEEAREMANAFGARMHVVTAIRKNEIHTFGTGSDRRVMTDAEIAHGQLDELSRDMGHVDVSTAVVEGTPAAQLVKEAKTVDADVIVVGNKNVQGLSSVLGSVAKDVAHSAPCAVLIAKTA
ncbi:MAG: universal stress protein [Acidimicrobiales bacterium]|nr:universal stress protein [Acidimicrobiales bacterium]RZV48789.1 MAG: universal stress protein [Acidimicrobiales bacterium]